MDDDDCRLIPAEVEAEKKAIDKAVEEWKVKKANNEEEKDDDVYNEPEMSLEDRMEEAMMEGKEKQRYFSHVAIPTQKDIEDALLLRKKQELIQAFALDEEMPSK